MSENKNRNSSLPVQRRPAVDWALQRRILVGYLIVVVALMNVPIEGPLFGMGMVPGSRGVFVRLAAPLCAALSGAFLAAWKGTGSVAANMTIFLIQAVVSWAAILFLMS